MSPPRFILMLLAATLLPGCRSAVDMRCRHEGAARTPVPELGRFARLPHKRVGCLPFTGPLTLFEAADPAHLGGHSYSGRVSPGPDGWEVERGMMYARRGGFVDLCHVRLAADLVAYLHPRFRHALLHDWSCFRVRGEEPSLYHVTIRYPEWWSDLEAAEREALIDDLSIRLAQHLALTMTSWHELLTWFGFKSAVIFSEKGSAFTWEDSSSHALGVWMAGEALRREGSYDEAMTEVLAQTLEDLQVTDEAVLGRAIDAVKGDWWDGLSTRRRNLDIGLDDGVVEPWLVPGMQAEEGALLAAFTLPTLNAVRGRDCSGVMEVEITPRVLESGLIFALLPERPSRVIHPKEDLPILLAHIASCYDEGLTTPGGVELAQE